MISGSQAPFDSRRLLMKTRQGSSPSALRFASTRASSSGEVTPMSWVPYISAEDVARLDRAAPPGITAGDRYLDMGTVNR